MKKRKNPHAVAMGRRGGLAKSEKKTRACQLNALISAHKRRQKKLALSA